MKVIPLVFIPVALGVSATPVGLASLTVNPFSLTVGQSATGTVAFDSPLRKGARITLTSNPSTIAWAPGSITVQGGVSSATFPVTAKSPGCARLQVSQDNITRSAFVYVHSTSTPVRLTIDRLAAPLPATFKGTVTITRPRGTVASLKGDLVTLSSSNSAVASVPRSVTVPSTATSVSFDIKPTGNGCAVITATWGGGNSGRAMMILADG